MWAPWEGPGLEHLRLVTSGSDVVANGLVIGLEAGRPFRIGYEVRCDGHWRVREVRAAAPDLERPVLELLADGEGHWKRGGGEPIPELDGCIDVDISATPFTNTLPIRRLGLEPRVKLKEGDWAKGIAQKFDLILCNPPYVAEDAELGPGVRDYEPDEALFAGKEGLDAYRELAPQLPGLLNPGGLAAVEIGLDQAEAVTELLARDGLQAKVATDLGGRPRAVLLTWIA